MPHRVALVTDSTCDIPAAWRDEYEIGIVPLTIILDGQPYLDGVELSAEEFYARLPHTIQHPSTSQPTPAAFLEAYQRAAAAGAEQVLVITISSMMSGTIESARLAARQAPLTVEVLDSRNNSMGLGWQVIAAARARAAGGGLDEMRAAAQEAQRKMVYFVALDTMEYLSKGGRIADAVKFLDSFLKIKPLIFVRPETGTVGASVPARTRQAVIEGLKREFFRRIEPGEPLHLAVLHNAVLEDARGLAEWVRAEYAPAEMLITITAPVLGAHTGPRAVALCGYTG